MSDIIIKDVAGFEGVNFNFSSSLKLDPTKPFPDNAFTDGEISVAQIGASASRKFSLGSTGKAVEFGMEGDISSALGVFRNANRLGNALGREGLSEPIADLINIKIKADENLIALRWGYGFKASVDGKIGLVPAAPGLNLKFGVDGQTAGLSVLLHARKRKDSVTKSIVETLKSWRLPRQVGSLDDLAPGTTVVYETMGSLGVSLGVKYGYDFSWAKEAIKIGQLSGDLQLKIDLGVKAQLGFSTTGRYALALSRDGNAKAIRAQVFRLNKKDWNFAFDGAMTAQAEKIPFPDNIDDFIKGVFNLNGSQVLKDFEKFLDPNADLEDLISVELVDQSRDLIKKVTGIDPIDAADEALGKFRELLTKWHELPHEITSMIYGVLDDAAKIDNLKDFLNDVVKVADDPTKIAKKIIDHLPQNLFNSEIEQWLTIVSGSGISSLLSNIEDEREKLVELAEKTIGLLDGGTVEDMLRKFQKEIEDKLNLDKITNLNPEAWLKKRLADFLGKQTVLMDELKTIRDAINKLRGAAREFYEKGYQALLEKYKFEVHYAFQRATSRSALIDITLDFSGNMAATDPNSPEACLEQFLDGDFSRLLTEQLDCVSINHAVFTHDIKRSTHLDVGLPYFKAFVDHVTESSSKLEIVEKDGDKLWVFSLKAQDTVKKKRSLSKLSIEATFAESSGVRKFSEETYKVTHKFQYAKKVTKGEYLQSRYGIAVSEYMQNSVPSYPVYLANLDRNLDSLGIVGADRFGNILTSLEISLPGSAIAAWKDVPEDPNHMFYQKASIAVQRRLRQWIPVAYIQEEDKYDETESVYPLLAYAALPPLVKKMKDRLFYWEFNDDSVRNSVFETNCRVNLLSNVLPAAFRASNNSAYLSNEDVLRSMKNLIGSAGKGRFESLCELERSIIESIGKTAALYHEFRNAPAGKPDEKLERLAEFGKEFVDTFNDDLGHISYTPKGALRPLGLILVKDLAEILDPTVSVAGFSALLELAVVKPAVDFDKAKDNFFKGNWPKSEDTLLQQRMISVTA